MMTKHPRRTYEGCARILIVDDHPLMQEGLTVRINQQRDMQVCGSAESVNEALAKIRELSPDLVIVDLGLLDSHGLDLIGEVTSQFPQQRMLVVSAYEENLFAERALRAGAMGYVNKREVQTTILEALRAVLAGDRYLSPSMTQRMLGTAFHRRDSDTQDPIARLSDRELEVFQLIGRGQTTRAIARQLQLSVHTVDTHREKIRHKLNVANSTELMQKAVTWVLENG